MAVNTTAGSKLYIGPVRAKTVDSLAEFEALSPYVEIGEAQNLGEIGDEATAVNFLGVSDGRTRKLKGSFDAGTMALACGRDPTDAGQIALKAASRVKFEYAFKLVYADAPDVGWTDSVEYFGALVMSARNTLGGADDVTMVNYNLGINTEIFESPSHEATP